MNSPEIQGLPAPNSSAPQEIDGMKEITGDTRLFGIAADPVHHVKTPERINEHFARIGYDGVCGSRACKDCGWWMLP